VAALFKAKLSLKRIAICVPWWDAANMQRCAKVGGGCELRLAVGVRG
jgi:hypothetical protein